MQSGLWDAILITEQSDEHSNVIQLVDGIVNASTAKNSEISVKNVMI